MFSGIGLVFIAAFIIIPIVLNILTRSTIWLVLGLSGNNLKDYYWPICSIWAVVLGILVMIKGDKK